MIKNDKPCPNDEVEHIDDKRRQFLLTLASLLGGGGALCALAPFISSWQPSAKARAQGAPVRVDIRALELGQRMTVLWRGKPVWIIRRAPEVLACLRKPNANLRDPASKVPQQPLYATNDYRSIKPEYLVLIGVCTHLGCSPLYQLDADSHRCDDGFYCPCHGSRFDLSGRVFKHMPAPINLEVPPYRFIDENTIEIGEENAS